MKKIRITKEKEPALFQLIEETYQQVGAPAPKHVFLTTDVNAFVSYDSSFWSMFLLVKKNLTIGLGLINSTTVSEFKSILAHEFGHFSQRSMKVGSYTNQRRRCYTICSITMKSFSKYKWICRCTCYFLFICNDSRLFYPWYTMGIGKVI